MNMCSRKTLPILNTFKIICQHLNLNANELLEIVYYNLSILDIKTSAGFGYINIDNPPIKEYFTIEKNILQ